MTWLLVHRHDPKNPGRVLWGSPAEIEVHVHGEGASSDASSSAGPPPRQRLGRKADGPHTVVIGDRQMMPASIRDLPGIRTDIISRRHLEFWGEVGAVWVEDLGSMNGTYVNGVRIAPHTATRLARGDILSLGGSRKTRVGQPRMNHADAFRYELVQSLATGVGVAAAASGGSKRKRLVKENPNADTPGGKQELPLPASSSVSSSSSCFFASPPLAKKTKSARASKRCRGSCRRRGSFSFSSSINPGVFLSAADA